MKRRIDAAGSIRQEKYFRTHHPHQPRRQYHVRDRISLVIVYPPLHQDNGHFIDVAENKLPGMSRHGGYRKSFDLTVGKFRLHIHNFCEVAKPRA